MPTNPADFNQDPQNPVLIPLSSSDLQYYQQLYEKQFNTTDPTNANVVAAIKAIEQSNTAQYATTLYGMFGPGGSYNPGGANTYDAGDQLQRHDHAEPGWDDGGALQVVYGNVGTNGTTSHAGRRRQLDGAWLCGRRRHLYPGASAATPTARHSTAATTTPSAPSAGRS